MRAAAALALISVIAIAAPARGGPEDDKKKAARLFKEGRDAIGAGKVDEACAKFEESFKLDAAIGTKLNLADCLERKGLLVAAYHLFDEAAVEAARTSKEGRESFARTRANALAAKLVQVQLRLADPVAPGATVVVAGVVVAPDAWRDPRFLAPGSIAVDVTAPGYTPFHTDVDGRGGDTKTVEVPALAPVGSGAPGGGAGPGPGPGGGGGDVVVGAGGGGGGGTVSSSPHRSRKLAYIVGGSGVGLLAGSLVLGLAARSTFRGADCGPDAMPPMPEGVCSPEGQKTTDRARLMADIGTGVAIAGVAAVGVGVWLFLRKGASDTGDHAVVTPTVSDDAVGVVVTFSR